MTDAFKYLSPREFHKLSTAKQERYLTALYENLHPEHTIPQKVAKAGRKPKRVSAKDPKAEIPES